MSATTTAVPKRNQRSLLDKFTIIKAFEAIRNQPGAKAKIVRDYGLPNTSCLNRILEKKEEVCSKFENNFSTDRKRFRTSFYPELDRDLYAWFLQMRSRNIELSGDLILQQASRMAAEKQIQNFSASQGFLGRFKQRYNINFRKLYGAAGSVNTDVVSGWMERLPSILGNYEPKDIFNWDETGLFYTQSHNASFITSAENENRNLRGRNQRKQRITVLVMASMAGEKLPLVVIGKYRSPRVFKNARLPVEYYSQKNSWMDASIFEKILVNFDKAMGIQNRKVLLFIDNCSAHPQISLQNVTIQFFPPNVTSKCQPLDMGIIQCMKHYYKNEIQRRFLTAVNCGQDLPKITLLDALFFLKNVWLQQVSAATISNCFRKAGFQLPVTLVTDVEEIETETGHTDKTFDDDNLTVCSPDTTAPGPDMEEATENDSDNSTDADDCEVPTSAKAFQAIKTLHQYFSTHNGEEEALIVDNLYTKLDRIAKNSLSQALVTSYFTVE